MIRIRCRIGSGDRKSDCVAGKIFASSWKKACNGTGGTPRGRSFCVFGAACDRQCGRRNPLDFPLGGSWIQTVVEAVMTYYLLAARSLRDESMAVCRKLEAGETEGARYAVSMIVGRDTKPLSEAGIARAAVETVAENASDGVIAPLFYLAIGGPLLGWLYKAVNTMDSMVGYKNDRYLHFGRAAAKLDDLVNLIPSRLAALLLIALHTFYDMTERMLTVSGGVIAGTTKAPIPRRPSRHAPARWACDWRAMLVFRQVSSEAIYR